MQNYVEEDLVLESYYYSIADDESTVFEEYVSK